MTSGLVLRASYPKAKLGFKFFFFRILDVLTVIVLYAVVPGMLEYESIPGVSSSKPFGGRSKAHADITVKSITKMVSYSTKERSPLYFIATLGRSLSLGKDLD